MMTSACIFHLLLIIGARSCVKRKESRRGGRYKRGKGCRTLKASCSAWNTGPGINEVFRVDPGAHYSPQQAVYWARAVPNADHVVVIQTLQNHLCMYVGAVIVDSDPVGTTVLLHYFCCTYCAYPPHYSQAAARAVKALVKAGAGDIVHRAWWLQHGADVRRQRGGRGGEGLKELLSRGAKQRSTRWVYKSWCPPTNGGRV